MWGSGRAMAGSALPGCLPRLGTFSCAGKAGCEWGPWAAPARRLGTLLRVVGSCGGCLLLLLLLRLRGPNPRSFAADGSSEHPGKRVPLLPGTAALLCVHPSFPTHPVNPCASPNCSLCPVFLRFLVFYPIYPTTEQLSPKGTACPVPKLPLVPVLWFWGAAVTQAGVWPAHGPLSAVPSALCTITSC